MIDTPHIAFPFRLNRAGTSLLVTEQDSAAEIEACIEVLLRTPIGSRIEAPEYGVIDQVFHQNGIDINAVLAAIRQWEDRAPVEMERLEPLTAELVDRIRLKILTRS